MASSIYQLLNPVKCNKVRPTVCVCHSSRSDQLISMYIRLHICTSCPNVIHQGYMWRSNDLLLHFMNEEEFTLPCTTEWIVKFLAQLLVSFHLTHYQLKNLIDLAEICLLVNNTQSASWIVRQGIIHKHFYSKVSKLSSFSFLLMDSCIPESDDFRSHVGRSPETSVRPFLYCVLEATQEKVRIVEVINSHKDYNQLCLNSVK